MSDDFPRLDFELMYKALNGDADATRIYCGSYALVVSPSGIRYRCRGVVPDTFRLVIDAYDKDGFLLDKYWSLPRIIDGQIGV